MFKSMVRKVFHLLQKNYFTFRLLVWLKEYGIVKRYGFPIGGHEKMLRRYPSEEMLKSNRFYEENAKRLQNLRPILADKKSLSVLGGGDKLSCCTRSIT